MQQATTLYLEYEKILSSVMMCHFFFFFLHFCTGKGMGWGGSKRVKLTMF